MKSDLKSNLKELLSIFQICLASCIPLNWCFEISLWSHGNSESFLKTLPKAGMGKSKIILCQSYDEMNRFDYLVHLGFDLDSCLPELGVTQILLVGWQI